MEAREHRRRIEANLWRYQAFSLVIFTPFMMPVIVLFWRDNGLDLVDVHLLQAIYAVVVVLLEVPTGMVADRLGKRASLVSATGCLIAGIIVYALGYGFWSFLVAELTLALGAALYSGAGSALLCDSLGALDRADEYQRYEGRARAMQALSLGVCALIGGFVGARSYRATVWLTAIGSIIALPLALSLTEVQPAPGRGVTFRQAMDGYRQLISGALRFVLRHQLVRWLILFFAVLIASGLWTLWIYQPYMELCQLPVWMFGVAFALFNLVSAAGSQLADRVDRRFGERGVLWLLGLLQLAVPLLMAELITPASFLLVLGHQAVRGIAPPVISARVMRYTFADKRATVLSICSMAGRLLYGATALGFGWIAEHVSLRACLGSQGGSLLLLLGGLALAFTRIDAKYFAVKDKVRAHQ